MVAYNMPAPLGNTNGSKSNRIWADALRKELAGNKNAKALRDLARVLIAEAEGGNLQALKEIGDRLDGKPKQQTEISGPEGGDIPLSFNIEYIDTDTEET